jgi:hypothetical protein
VHVASSLIDVGTDTTMNHATTTSTTRSASPGLRPSLGGSFKSLPHEIRDLSPYLKFVNRENECYQCIEVFQNVYKKYHEMTENKNQVNHSNDDTNNVHSVDQSMNQSLSSSIRHSSSSSCPIDIAEKEGGKITVDHMKHKMPRSIPRIDDKKRDYCIVICGGAPGVGMRRQI